MRERQPYLLGLAVALVALLTTGLAGSDAGQLLVQAASSPALIKTAELVPTSVPEHTAGR
jgi:hypothetical protein